MEKRRISPITKRDIWEKLELIERKLDEQKDTQVKESLQSFGIIYATLGLTMIVAVLITLGQKLTEILIIGFLIIIVGLIFILGTDLIFKILKEINRRFPNK